MASSLTHQIKLEHQLPTADYWTPVSKQQGIQHALVLSLRNVASIYDCHPA